MGDGGILIVCRILHRGIRRSSEPVRNDRSNPINFTLILIKAVSMWMLIRFDRFILNDTFRLVCALNDNTRTRKRRKKQYCNSRTSKRSARCRKPFSESSSYQKRRFYGRFKIIYSTK